MHADVAAGEGRPEGYNAQHVERLLDQVAALRLAGTPDQIVATFAQQATRKNSTGQAKEVA